MPRWWVLSVLLAGSGAVAAAKMPPKPAAHRPAFILSQEKPEQPPKLAATDVAPAAVKVGRLRGGGYVTPEDLVGNACMYIKGSAKLLLLTVVYHHPPAYDWAPPPVCRLAIVFASHARFHHPPMVLDFFALMLSVKER